MSDRPDDISEEVWEAASRVVGSPDVFVARSVETIVQERIARAIDQARREGYAAGVRAAGVKRHHVRFVIHYDFGHRITSVKIWSLMYITVLYTTGTRGLVLVPELSNSLHSLVLHRYRL